jgi:multidrug efflux system outer membrane protein
MTPLNLLPVRSVARLTGAVVILSVLSGCLVGPDYERPPVALPESFRAQTPVATASAAATEVVLTEWWTLFNDPILNELVTSAQTNNADVQIAVARLVQAQALARQAGAAKGLPNRQPDCL